VDIECIVHIYLEFGSKERGRGSGPEGRKEGNSIHRRMSLYQYIYNDCNKYTDTHLVASRPSVKVRQSLTH
jgi:hypothetical protein